MSHLKGPGDTTPPRSGHASLRGGGADRAGLAKTFGQRQWQDGAWKEDMARRHAVVLI